MRDLLSATPGLIGRYISRGQSLGPLGRSIPGASTVLGKPQGPQGTVVVNERIYSHN